MNVRELIEFLQTQPQDLPVAYDCFSEHCLLEHGDIRILKACEPRPDGWIHRSREDMPAVDYLMLPGN